MLLYHTKQLTVGDMKKCVIKKWGMVLKWLGTTKLKRNKVLPID